MQKYGESRPYICNLLYPMPALAHLYFQRGKIFPSLKKFRGRRDSQRIAPASSFNSFPRTSKMQYYFLVITHVSLNIAPCLLSPYSYILRFPLVTFYIIQSFFQQTIQNILHDGIVRSKMICYKQTLQFAYCTPIKIVINSRISMMSSPAF